jgi:hypothetical protein
MAKQSSLELFKKMLSNRDSIRKGLQKERLHLTKRLSEVMAALAQMGDEVPKRGRKTPTKAKRGGKRKRGASGKNAGKNLAEAVSAIVNAKGGKADATEIKAELAKAGDRRAFNPSQLVNQGILKKVGTAPRKVGQKGAPSGVYSVVG